MNNETENAEQQLCSKLATHHKTCIAAAV